MLQNAMPKTGTLEFDFSCTLPPSKSDSPLSDERVVRILVSFFLLSDKDRFTALDDLRKYQKMGEVALACDGHTVHKASLERGESAAHNLFANSRNAKFY